MRSLVLLACLVSTVPARADDFGLCGTAMAAIEEGQRRDLRWSAEQTERSGDYAPAAEFWGMLLERPCHAHCPTKKERAEIRRRKRAAERRARR